MLQRNLYDALLSLYLKETKNIIRCNTTQLLIKFLSPENDVNKTVSRIRSALGREYQDKNIELPKLGVHNEITVTPYTIDDIITITQPGSEYCRLPVTDLDAQRRILDLDLESPERRYIRSSKRIGEFNEKSRIIQRLQEITDEESGRNDEPDDGGGGGRAGGAKTRKRRKGKKGKKSQKRKTKKRKNKNKK